MTRSTLHACESCGREFPSVLAAADCADQDAYEEDDRLHGRVFGIHRMLEPSTASAREKP